MKKVFLIIAFAIGLNTFAQDQLEPLEKMDKKTTDQKIDFQLKKITTDLSLNENQIIEVRKVLTDSQTLREVKMNEIKSKKAEGNKLSKEEKKNLIADLKDSQKNEAGKMKQILNPEQFGKWEKMQAERKEKIREKMKEIKEEKLN